MNGALVPVPRALAAISQEMPALFVPQSRRLLEDAHAGLISEVLVYKLDRLGRDARMILNAVDSLEKLGTGLRSMTEEFDTRTATGRLMLTLLSGFAAHEREVIRERSMAGTKRLAQAGAWLGGIVPYGYRKEGERCEARLVVSSLAGPVSMVCNKAHDSDRRLQSIENKLDCLAGRDRRKINRPDRRYDRCLPRT